MNEQVVAYLGLGTNLGDRLAYLEQAVALIRQIPNLTVTNLSSIYETAPVGFIEQPDFYNMVIEIQTSRSPIELLRGTLRIEEKLHRVRKVRWGPRTIDIDLLLYGDASIDHPDLQVPHPRMAERAFVLLPLFEIAGNIEIPGTGKKLISFIQQLPSEQEVHKISYSLQPTSKEVSKITD